MAVLRGRRSVSRRRRRSRSVARRRWAAVKKDLEPEDVLPVTQREETAEEAAEREEYEKLEKWAEELKKKKCSVC